MGFDSDLDDESESEMDLESQRQDRIQKASALDSPDHLPIFEDQLLDGLQLWLDRLEEKTTSLLCNFAFTVNTTCISAMLGGKPP
jgi:hypothetical protein